MQSRTLPILAIAAAFLLGAVPFAAMSNAAPPPDPVLMLAPDMPDDEFAKAFEAEFDAALEEAAQDLDIMILADKNTLSPKDGCHNSKAVGYRHYHVGEDWEAAGECEKKGDINYRVPNVEPVRAGPSERCEMYLSWLEGDGPEDWAAIDTTTFGKHPIVNKTYVAGFVEACRE